MKERSPYPDQNKPEIFGKFASFKKRIFEKFSRSDQDPQKVDTNSFTPESKEEVITTLKGTLANIAIKFETPVKLVLETETVWFDAQGTKVNPANGSRFEQMLGDDDISFLNSTNNENTSDILYVQAEVSRYLNVVDYPIKINNIWFDLSGNVITNQVLIDELENLTD